MRPSVVVDRPAKEVVLLTLDRGERRNAIDRRLVDELIQALAAVEEPAVVLASADPSAFCAGADVSLPQAERRDVSDLIYAACERIVAMPAVVIAALDAPAVGGGALLAAAADLRVAGPRAELSFVGPRFGLVVGASLLPSLVGRGRALDVCLTMRPVPAKEAHAIGLVERLADDARAAAVELAQEIAAADPAVVAGVKALTRTASGIAEALAAERRFNAGR